MTSGCRKEQKDSCAVGVETNPFFRKSSKAENSRNVFKDGNHNFIFPLSLHISKQVKIFLKNIRFLREHWKYCEQQVILIYIFTYFHARIFFYFKSMKPHKTCLICTFGLTEEILKNCPAKQKVWRCEFRFLNEISKMILKRNICKMHLKITRSCFGPFFSALSILALP